MARKKEYENMINSLPESAELKNYNELLPKIRQKGPYWCIPASIENMLKYVGISDISQEELVLNYCQKFANDALILRQGNKYFQVKIDSLTDEEIIDLAIKSALKHANFGTFKEAVEKSSNYDSTKYELLHIINITESDEYLKILRESIVLQRPVLIATTNTDGNSHIRVVCSYDSSHLTLYDPALDKILVVQNSSFKFNSDILILRKTIISE